MDVHKMFMYKWNSQASVQAEGPMAGSGGTVLSRDEIRRQLSGTPTTVRIDAKDDESTAVDTDVSVYEDTAGKVTGIIELSTLRQTQRPNIKVRVLCLIDVSGSMLLKGDKCQSRSKISILKNMAVDIIDALEDEEDFFGVMTFGKESRVICPLTRVTSTSRTHVKEKVRRLDEGSGFSPVTDLSSALQDALDMLNAEQEGHSLLYRNCIIIFSDGEINAGITDPQTLVYKTHEKMRECTILGDVMGDLWVNLSCVTTGSNFSRSLYLLSKMCGNDAYFYIDGSKAEHPESSMLVPLMLRKMACAQMVSVVVKFHKGVQVHLPECTKEYQVRRRKTLRGIHDDSLTYFIHDMPAGVKKTFRIAADVDNMSSDAEEVMSLYVEYIDTRGILHNVKKVLTRHQILSLRTNRAACLQHLSQSAASRARLIFQTTCRNVSQILEEVEQTETDSESGDNHINDARQSIQRAVRTGCQDINTLRSETLPQLGQSESEKELDELVDALVANLNHLLSRMERNINRPGKAWQLSKAMSSAVARQCPTVHGVLVNPGVVCPLQQREQQCFTKRMQALGIYVFGAEEESQPGASLKDAARDVASSLADVLKALESAN